MRLPKVAISFAVLALALSACGDPDEGTTEAFNSKTSTMTDSESSEAEASTNMTAADMPQTSTTDPSTGTTDPSSSTTDPSTSTSTTTGGGNCGNGTVDPMGEQCDGSNLNGFTCVDLGFSGGTLACDPVTCTYDSSSCTTNPGTTG